MAKLMKESNQLNLTVVALVALVAIVGLVALVLNAASLATLSENVATGIQPVAADTGVSHVQVPGQPNLEGTDGVLLNVGG